MPIQYDPDHRQHGMGEDGVMCAAIRAMLSWFGRAEPLALGPQIKVDWGPEDVLVVTTDRELSQSEAQYLKDHLTGFVDRADKVLVLPRGFDVRVIHRSAA